MGHLLSPESCPSLLCAFYGQGRHRPGMAVPVGKLIYGLVRSAGGIQPSNFADKRCPPERRRILIHVLSK